MRGTAVAQQSWSQVEVICGELLDDDGFLATLGTARGTVFCDEDFDCLYSSNKGRPSHPPSLLASLLLAQLFYGVSDREAERRSRLDLSWKAALGLPLEHRGVPHVCLAEFRARLVRAGMEAWLHERLLRLAKAAGVLGHRRVVDSTGIADCVLTQDTVSLVRAALRRCLARLAELDPGKAGACAGLLARQDYDEAGKPEICWASAGERAALVNELFADAQKVAQFCRPQGDAALAGEVELLRVVSAQDVEDDDAGGVRIAQAVAPERVISVVDPEARHGHRSRRDRYDGYKAARERGRHPRPVRGRGGHHGHHPRRRRAAGVAGGRPHGRARGHRRHPLRGRRHQESAGPPGHRARRPRPAGLGQKGLFQQGRLRHRPGGGHRHLPRRPGGHHTHDQGRSPPSPFRRLDVPGLPVSLPVHEAGRRPHH